MKKSFIYSFIISLFCISTLQAKSLEDSGFEPPISDNNMSVVFPSASLLEYSCGSLVAFVKGAPVSESFIIGDEGNGGVAVVAADNLCACDLVTSEVGLNFAILTTESQITLIDLNPIEVYSPNGFIILSSTLGFINISGCTNPVATNYDLDAIEDDGSCVMPVLASTDSEAANFNAEADTEDDSCIGFVSNGSCLILQE